MPRALGLGIGLNFGGAVMASEWSPTALFAASEVGVWYDPSDMSSMFQDNLGATPVTAVEQTVGRINDKSGNGKHATQATLAQRPTLRARYNQFTYSEAFDNAAWTKTNVTITANSTTDPLGGSTADTLVEDSATNIKFLAFGSSSFPPAGLRYSLSVYAKANGRTKFRYGSRSSGAYADFDLTAVTATTSGALLDSTPQSATITSVGNGWYLCSVVFLSTAVINLTPLIHPLDNSGVLSYTGDGVSGFHLWGADMRFNTDVGTSYAYQRIAAATDYDTVGFLPYLAFDGSDDSLATAAIDFSATDAVTVFAGVRKLSDAARGTIVELTASAAGNNGAFHLTAPNAASATYAFESKGTALTDAVASSGVAAPITSVLTGYSDISADSAILRVNGVQADADVGDQGTGNFSNAVLYIGRRGGSTLPANMRLYSLIVTGATVTAGNRSSAESYVATETGVTL